MIPEQVNAAIVRSGSRVRIRTGDAQQDWTIVGPEEADAQSRLLSERSPLGFALLGHGVGDQVKVDGPGGRRIATIVAVSNAR